MKTADDPRHKKRIRTFKSLFSQLFAPQDIRSKTARKVLEDKQAIDKIIAQAAPEWPIEQINKVDLSVLRLSIWELLNRSKIPTKVIIDEAVEIAKRYGSKSSGSFINGALAAAIPLTRPHEESGNKTHKKT